MSRYQTYPEYKKSEIGYLREIPKDWITGKVKFSFLNLDKRRIPLSAEERGDRKGEYPYYGASGIIDFVDGFLFDEETILIGEDGANLLNRSSQLAFLATGRYWVNNHAHILKAKDGLNNFWVLTLEHIDITPFVSGSAQPKLTAEALGDLEIAYPSTIVERKSIASFLDHETAKIDTLIEKQQQLIKLLKEKRQAVISNAVTKGLNPKAPMRDSGVEWLGEVPAHWVVTEIRYITHQIGGGTPSKDNEGYWNGNIPWVSPKDMKVDYIDDSQDKITESAVKNSSVKLIPEGSVLIVVRGMILAHSVPVALTLKKVTVNQDMKSLLPVKGVVGDFLLFLLKGLRDFILELVESSAHGTQCLRTESFERMKVAMPSVDEQVEIVNHIQNKIKIINSLIDKAIGAVELLHERRTALISAAVTGKIDVRNWQPPEQNQANKDVAA